MFRPRSVQQLTVRGSFCSSTLAPPNGADATADYTQLELLPQSTLLPGSGTPPRSPYDNDKRKQAPGGAVAARLRRASQQHAAALLQLLLLLLVASLWLLHAHSAYKASQPRHLIVLDAGSTGTRVHVFQYAPDAGSSYAALALPEPKLKVVPGLSSFADDAAGAAASLQPLLAFAARHVPAAQWRATPVYLMATAGLRLLPRAAVDAILHECRGALAASAFLFEPQWADVISGTNEGLYAWVAANYAAGHLQAAAEDAAHGRKDLHHGAPPFKALIELGGASAQVTFIPHGSQQQHHMRGKQQHSKHSVRLKLPGVSHHSLWTHSFLGFGFDVVQSKVDALIKQATPSSSVAQDKQQQQQQDSSLATGPAQAAAAADAAGGGSGVLLDPCLPVGYAADDGRVGSGVWAQCQVLVARAMDPARCQPGNQHTPCPELPTDMPELAGELLAIENFAYTARALSVPAVATLSEFATAARAFCSRPWPQTLQAHSHEPEQQQLYLWRYCFGSAFAWTLLHQVLQIGDSQRLHFTNALTRADGAELGLDWALGAAVLQLSNNSAAEGAQLRRQQRHQRLLLAAAVLCSGVLAAGLLLTAAGVLQRHHVAAPSKLAPHVPWLTVELPQPSTAGGGGGVEAASGGSSDWGRVMSASSWAASSPAATASAGPSPAYHVR